MKIEQPNILIIRIITAEKLCNSWNVKMAEYLTTTKKEVTL